MSKRTPPHSVLFVCIGNICRSPYAEALLRHLLGDETVVESAGIFASTGLRATDEIIEIGRRNQLDLSSHRARHLRDLDLDRYDLVVALTPDIRRTVIDDYRLDPDRVIALEIDDPYGGTIEIYRHCVEEIRDAVTRLAEEWS